MNKAANDWNEVGSKLNGLGQKLRYHVEQARNEDSAEVKDALQKLSDAIDQAFEGLRSATKDPAIKDDIKSAATAFTTALGSTFDEVGVNLQDLTREAKEAAAKVTDKAKDLAKDMADTAKDMAETAKEKADAAKAKVTSDKTAPADGATDAGNYATDPDMSDLEADACDADSSDTGGCDGE